MSLLDRKVSEVLGWPHPEHNTFRPSSNLLDAILVQEYLIEEGWQVLISRTKKFSIVRLVKNMVQAEEKDPSFTRALAQAVITAMEREQVAQMLQEVKEGDYIRVKFQDGSIIVGRVTSKYNTYAIGITLSVHLLILSADFSGHLGSCTVVSEWLPLRPDFPVAEIEVSPKPLRLDPEASPEESAHEFYLKGKPKREGLSFAEWRERRFSSSSSAVTQQT